MTKERKMEMSMVKAYGFTAMEDILEASRKQELEQERANERMINDVFMKPDFEQSLIDQANSASNTPYMPNVPSFLEKYKEA